MIGVALYAFSKNISTASEIINLLDSDRYLRTFTCNTRITNTTLKRFLEEGNRTLFKKVHLATLVEANDYDILDYLHLFVDCTDANINGSKHYKIYREEYETLIKLHEYGLLSKKRQSKHEFKNREKYLIKKYTNNLKVLDLIKKNE
jgi:hypothetical protein